MQALPSIPNKRRQFVTELSKRRQFVIELSKRRQFVTELSKRRQCVTELSKCLSTRVTTNFSSNLFPIFSRRANYQFLKYIFVYQIAAFEPFKCNLMKNKYLKQFR